MSNFEQNLDNMISKILKEEIENKSSEKADFLVEGGEWTEIEVDEALHGGQKKLDKNKNGKIDAEDFKLLRKKKETKEQYLPKDVWDDAHEKGHMKTHKELGINSDNDSFEDSEEASQQEPTYVGKGLADNKIKADLTNKFFGSFADEHGWFDNMDYPYEGSFDFDFEEEEFPDFDSLMSSPYAREQRWFAPERSDAKKHGMVGDGRKFFDLYQKKFGGKPFRIRKMKSLDEQGETKEYFHYDNEDFDEYDMGEKYKLMSIPDGDYSGIGDIMRKRYNKDMDISDDEEEESIEEQETEEGNAFSGALAKAKEQGKDTFEVDGKKYNVKEARDKFDGRKSKVIGVYSNIDKQRKEMGEKWEGDVDVKQTGQYSDKTIAQLNAHIKKLKAKNEKTKEEGKKVSDADKTKMSQLYFAKRAKQGWKGKGKAAVKESLQLTEDELIDMIEKIVLEQKVKDRAEKNNITTKKAEGLKKTEKVLKADKKENEDYAKLVVKKMKEYLKPGSVGEFNESPENFPQSNYTQGKMKEKTMKYHPSQAVDEYIEAFAYPGQTNLVFDEIKPDDKKIEKYLKGDKTTGNAVKDENGKALGNVVPSEVGERFMKNYEDNLYGAEQMNVSYKRQPQPVDVGGTDKMTGSLKSIRKGSTAKAGKILNQLESTDEKGQNLIKEDLNKIFKLMKYNEKTQ